VSAMPMPAPMEQCSPSSMILRGSALLCSIANSLDDLASRRTLRTFQSDASQTRSLGLWDTRYRHRMPVTLSPRFAHKYCRYSAKYWRSERLKRAERSNWEKRLGNGVRSANHALHFFHRPSCLSMASFCGLILALAWEAMHRQFTR
jgi:hypothetical protein